MYGKRRIVLLLLALLVVGSVIAALSTSLLGVIIGRALQGAVIGVVPLGIAILRDVLHTNRVNSAIALISATLGVGGALGLPISAFVTEYADWHILFWLAAGARRRLLRARAVDRAGERAAHPGQVRLRRRGGPRGRAHRHPARHLARQRVGLALAADARARTRRDRRCCSCGAGSSCASPSRCSTCASPARRPVLLTNLASIGMGFALFASNVVFPQILELPVETGAGFGLSLIAASLIVMPAGLVMMVLSPVSGRLSRVVGPRVLLIMGAIALVAAYAFVLIAGSEVWHIFVSNILIGVGIGFGFAAMPMLIMRSVPQSETGASNGLNALFRSLGTSTAAAVMGAVLASSSTVQGGMQIPSAAGFQLTYLLAGRRRRDGPGPGAVHPGAPRARGAASVAARVTAPAGLRLTGDRPPAEGLRRASTVRGTHASSVVVGGIAPPARRGPARARCRGSRRASRRSRARAPR